MELHHDWRALEKVFLPKSGRADGSDPSILILVEEDRVHAAWARDGRDLSSLQGERVSAVVARFPKAECAVLTRDQMEEWVNGSVTAGNFLAPVANSPLTRKLPHFLLRWMDEPGRLPGLPHSFGLYLKIIPSAGEAEELILVRRRGRLDQVTRPDFTVFGSEKRNPLEMLRSLGERYGVPMQIAEVPKELWEKLSSSPKPWREFLAGVRAGEIRLTPTRSKLLLTAIWKWF